jgi:hypothetical protein
MEKFVKLDAFVQLATPETERKNEQLQKGYEKALDQYDVDKAKYDQDEMLYVSRYGKAPSVPKEPTYQTDIERYRPIFLDFNDYKVLRWFEDFDKTNNCPVIVANMANISLGGMETYNFRYTEEQFLDLLRQVRQPETEEEFFLDFSNVEVEEALKG